MKQPMMNIAFAGVLALVSAAAVAAGTDMNPAPSGATPNTPSAQGGAYGGDAGTGMTGTSKAVPSFKSTDGNHDGKISADEYTKAGGTESDFQQLDANHDGMLEKGEVAR